MIKRTAKLLELEVGPANVDVELAKVKSNRKRAMRHVKTYVRLIKKGLFRNGGLIFADEKGLYHDGGHRFMALKITGYTALFWVISGLNKIDLAMMVDSGKKRSNSARLAASGIVNASLICKSIEEALDVLERWKRTTEMLMPDEVLGYLDKHPELHDLAQNWASSGVDDVPAKYLVAFQHLFTKIDSELSDRFFAGITHRKTLKAGEPLFAFNEMLKSEAFLTDEKKERRDRYIKNGLIIAWNAMLQGKGLDKIELVDRPITLEGTVQVEPESFTSDDAGTEENGTESDDQDSEE
jgi:hypothetical protein